MPGFIGRLATRTGKPPPSAPPSPNSTLILDELSSAVASLVEPAVQRLREAELRHGNQAECFSSAAGVHLRFRCCVYFTALAAGLIEQHFNLGSSAWRPAVDPPSSSARPLTGRDKLESLEQNHYGAMARWLLQPAPDAPPSAFTLAAELISEADRTAGQPSGDDSGRAHRGECGASSDGWKSSGRAVKSSAVRDDAYGIRQIAAAAGRLPGPVGRYAASLTVGGVSGTLWRCEVSTVHTYLVFRAPGLEDVLIDMTFKQLLLIAEWMEPRHFEAARAAGLFSELPDHFVGTSDQLARLMTLPSLEAAMRSAYEGAGDDPQATLRKYAAGGMGLEQMHALRNDAVFLLRDPQRRLEHLCGRPSQHQYSPSQ